MKSYKHIVMSDIIYEVVDREINSEDGITYELCDRIGNYFSRSLIYDQEDNDEIIKGLIAAI